MDGTYPDDISKMALVLTSAQMAKRVFVDQNGVGEDLAFNFMGWKTGRIAVIAQLEKSFMKIPPVDRLQKCAAMLRVMRGHWDIDAVSMIAEGYCSSDIEKTRGLDLQKVFLEKEDTVTECITVTHVESGLEEPEINIVSISYKYQAGRRVVFSPVTLYPEGAIRTLRDKSYPAMLYKIIGEDYVIDAETDEEAADMVNELGFHLQVFGFN